MGQVLPAVSHQENDQTMGEVYMDELASGDFTQW